MLIDDVDFSKEDDVRELKSNANKIVDEVLHGIMSKNNAISYFNSEKDYIQEISLVEQKTEIKTCSEDELKDILNKLELKGALYECHLLCNDKPFDYNLELHRRQLKLKGCSLPKLKQLQEKLYSYLKAPYALNYYKVLLPHILAFIDSAIRNATDYLEKTITFCMKTIENTEDIDPKKESEHSKYLPDYLIKLANKGKIEAPENPVVLTNLEDIVEYMSYDLKMKVTAEMLKIFKKRSGVPYAPRSRKSALSARKSSSTSSKKVHKLVIKST